MSDNTKPTCSICGGEGAVTAFGSYESADGTQPCQACNGTGEQEETAIKAQLAAAQAEVAKWREACFKARESGVRALMEIEKLEER